MSRRVAPDGLAGGLGALVIADRSVDQLAQDVDVPGVPGGLLHHVDQHPAHRDGVAEPGGAGVLDNELVDDLIGRCPFPPVEGQDVTGRPGSAARPDDRPWPTAFNQ